jgi:hypothetical protein
MKRRICHTFDLMRECIADAYRVQGEESEGGSTSIILQEVIIKEEEEGSEVMEEEDLVEEEDQLYVIIVINLDICVRLSESLHDVHILQTTRPCNGGFPTVDRKVERKEEPKCTDDSSRGMMNNPRYSGYTWRNKNQS